MRQKMGKVILKRQNGAILEPIPDHLWESQAVFNPATVRDGAIIHMLYRAVKAKNYSTIGYASLNLAGEILGAFGEPGRTEGKLGWVHYLTELPDGSVIVAEIVSQIIAPQCRKHARACSRTLASSHSGNASFMLFCVILR